MFKASSFRLQMYEICPRQYKFVYVDKVADKYKTPKPYLTMGAHVHNALKDFYEKCEPQERNFEILAQFLRRRWRENREGFADTEDEHKWGVKALNMLKLLCARMDVRKTPRMLEDYYAYDINDALSVLGRIDRVDQEKDGLHVIDYKTGVFAPEDVNETQLQLYSLIIAKNTQETVARASFLYLPSFQWYTITPQLEDYDYIQEKLRLQVEKIQADQEYAPRVNKFCKNCDFLEICPAQEEAMEYIKQQEL